jgi:hypothetical protein
MRNGISVFSFSFLQTVQTCASGFAAARTSSECHDSSSTTPVLKHSRAGLMALGKIQRGFDGSQNK